jgi:hypothetical protein
MSNIIENLTLVYVNNVLKFVKEAEFTTDVSYIILSITTAKKN